MRYDHERFLANWKTDDKEWIKLRKLEWKNIQWQLDRLRANYIFSGIKKSDYKYFKSYFLTGKDSVETPSNVAFRCLGSHGLSWNEDLFIQFWLSADHSEECLEYLKNSCSDEIDYFNSACDLYRRTTDCYPYSGKYGWDNEEGTTEKNGSVFGKLEPRMLTLFAYENDKKQSLDDRIDEPYNAGVFVGFEGVFIGYFETLVDDGSGEIPDGFNPNNPIRYMIDEYMRWGFPQHRRPDADTVTFNLAMAVIWHTVENPEGRHPIQLEVAKELKQRILDYLDTIYAGAEAQTRFSTAMKYYESGEFKEYLLDYQ